MARTAEGAQATRTFRQGQVSLRAAVLRDVSQLWPLWNVRDVDSYQRFVDAAVTLIRSRRSDSAELAASYYRSFRAAENVSGAIEPAPAETPAAGELAASLRATGLSATLRAFRMGRGISQARQQGLVAVSGSTGRMVLDGGRETIANGVRQDRQALGWTRVTDANPCYFCAMLAGRGPVFTEETVGFRAHDHCACTAEPAFEGSEWPGRAREFEQLYAKSTGGVTGQEKIRAFRRAYEGRQ